MGHLALSFLGGFTVFFNAEPITFFGSDKVRALLVYLSMEVSRSHRRTELAALFWPELSEKKASHNFSQSLLRLRQALHEKKGATSPSFLTVTTQDVQFNPYSDYQLDVARFRELLSSSQHHRHNAAATCTLCAQWLTQAAELYQGDLLAGLFVPGSVAFEEWRLLQQEELHRQALETLERLAIYHEQRGEFEPMQSYARRQIALEPWREEAHVQLMRALAHSGQIVAALNQYELYRRTLTDELGIKPAASVVTLYEQMRAGKIGQTAETPDREEETIWLSSQGERRQVTILACNRIAAPESGEIPEQTTLCGRHCEAIFHRFGGQRTLRQGNACLVYFGYPQAYEDAARRAVHSGLAVAAAFPDAGAVRIGIHTGLMVVGEKRGPRWQDRDLLGTAFEITRECQRLAQPGEVVITEATQRLIQESFDLQVLASQMSDGQGQHLSAYQVRGESGVPDRLDWLAQTQRLTPLVGREDELRQLQTGWERGQQGRGQVVLLRGEPGIGKSRLIWEMKKRTYQDSHSPVFWLTAHCFPHYQNSSLYPMVRLLEQLLGFQTEDSVAARRDKLMGKLGQYELNSPSAVWLMALLLGLPTGAPSAATITKTQRERMRQVFMALLQKQAAERPIVLVIEDLHWSDPSTVEWLGQSLNSVAAAACLVLLTARPGFDPFWLSPQAGRPGPILLALNPLSSEQADQMINALAGEELQDEGLRQHIITQSDGIPLFVEELTKVVLEQPALTRATKPTPPIPASLLDSLVARLDHLGVAKETAQWLATLGREVSYALLQACVPYDESRLQSDLARLIEAELVSPLNQEPQTGMMHLAAAAPRSGPTHYTFKHALVQDAAYTAMLKRTRQAYHRRIAETAARQFPQWATTRPEIMAHHYAQAGLSSSAADYWMQAGERATAHGATVEAKIFFDRALDAMAPEDGEHRWQALWGRETALFFQGERLAQEADIVALHDLAETLDDDTRRAQVHIRQARFATAQANYREQLAAAESAIVAASRSGAVAVTLEALAYKITALLRLGRRQDVPQAVAQTLTQVQQVDDDHIRAYAMAAVALYYVEIGDLAGAAQALAQSLEAARHAPVRHLDLESQYYGHLGFTYAQLGLYSEARAALAAGLEIALLMGIGRYQAYHRLNEGFISWRMGDLPTAIEREEHALAEYRASGELFGAAACQAYLGYIYETAGDLVQAEKNLAEANAGFAALGVEPDKFEVRAVQARIALRQGQVTQAGQLAHEVWHYLHQQGTEGLSSPSWVYVCLADVLEAVEIPGITLRQVIETGYHELRQRAEKLSHTAWYHSFLENVAENRTLIERWKTMAS